MIMPFGKHKGQDIHTVPHDYLLWFRDNITNLLRAVDAALEGKPSSRPRPENGSTWPRERCLSDCKNER